MSKLKQGIITSSESLKAEKKKKDDSLEEKPEKKRKLKKQDEVHELITGLHGYNHLVYYDDVNEQLYEESREQDLPFTNFYYYNMMKNSEDYEKEMKIK